MVPNGSYDEKLAFFFARQPPDASMHSTLSLLRGDIETCEKVVPLGQLKFPQAMCLMVEVDLLGKMMLGSHGNVGDRFKEFVNYALGSGYGTDIGDKIYSFRNALHHSYRMHTDWRTNWQFLLVDEPTVREATWDQSEGTIINLCRLRAEIEDGIRRFHTLLKTTTDTTKKNNFEEMFDLHGWMGTGRIALAQFPTVP